MSPAEQIRSVLARRVWDSRGRPTVDWRPLDRLPVAGLVATLASPERWNRQQAARVLAARPADTVAAAVRTHALPETDGRTRFEHLSARATAGRLDPDLLAGAARDPLPEIRAFAARLIGLRPWRPASARGQPSWVHKVPEAGEGACLS